MKKPLALIVEDNQLLSNMFSRALHDIGFETLCIVDGQEAFDWLSAQMPNLLLLDLHLPGMSGKEILLKFADNGKLDDTYTVIVTADAPMGGMLQDKADFLLNKPVDILQLQQLAQRLKNHQKSRIFQQILI